MRYCKFDFFLQTLGRDLGQLILSIYNDDIDLSKASWNMIKVSSVTISYGNYLFALFNSEEEME